MTKKILENQRVLIVDDQRAFQLMFKGILYSMGAQNVAFAPTGEQALVKCINLTYDVLFVDYHLGNGKNGKQLLEDLREKKLLAPHSIFMLITGETTVPMVVSAVELEPDDYLIKPFSQSLLRNRLEKIQRKKQQLQPIYQALYDEQHEKVVELCKEEIVKESRYQQYCKRVMIENLIKLKDYTAAEQVLLVALEQNRSGWALMLQAKLCYEQERHEESLKLCDEAIDGNRYFAEAFDTKAKNYLALEQTDEAFNCIKTAAEIAPFSITRQYMLLDIARQLDDSSNIIQATRQLYEITRRSFREDIIHLLNYIRTIIDAAIQADEPETRNRFMQDATIAIQRVRRDESLTREIDFNLFETLCQARLDSINGHQYTAKKSYAAVAEQVLNQEQIIPDAIFLLNQIGEYEQARTLYEQLPENITDNPILRQLMKKQHDNTETKQLRFSELNKEGIKYYKAQQYIEAVHMFEQALEVAPMNTGSALNYIQASIQLLNTQKKTKSTELFERCKKTFRIVDNMPLPEHHRIRYNELLQQFNKLQQNIQR